MKADYFWIALGSALGGIGRYWLSGSIARWFTDAFPRAGVLPVGTLFVNVTGSLAIGFIAGLAVPEGRFMIPASARQFLMIGILGGYTTFSSFSLQTLELMHDGEWFFAGANTVLSLAGCLLAVWMGFGLAQWLNR